MQPSEAEGGVTYEDPTATADRVGWLRLSRAGLAPHRLARLVSALATPQAIFDSSAQALSDIEEIRTKDVERVQAAARLDVTGDLAALDCLGVKLVTLYADDYPARLRDIYDPPAILYVQGELLPEDSLAVAVVGTRRCSPYGVRMAERLAGDLARRKVTIVSGLALGVDAAAHRGALAARGRTIGVLACGLDVDYPREHRALRQEVAASGAVIGELPFGTPPTRERFPQRNRIVSGVSLGTVVVEAPARSGSLITAQLAVEQGREVFAVPGDVDNPLNAGSHGLIREGAYLVESAEHVLDGLGVHLEAPLHPLREAPSDLSQEERAVFEALSFQPQHGDQLVQSSGLPPAVLAATLMLLEVKGLARRFPGGLFCRS